MDCRLRNCFECFEFKPEEYENAEKASRDYFLKLFEEALVELVPLAHYFHHSYKR